MKPSIRNRLNQLSYRMTEIDMMLADPSVATDMTRFCKLSRERSELQQIVRIFGEFTQVEQDLIAAKDMLQEPELKTMAEEEITLAKHRIKVLEELLLVSLLTNDPNDERNFFLEIRAATGGSESALFSGSLLRMYSRYAEKCNWYVELVSESPAELGGYKEVVMRINGKGAYKRLKFESGVHRVQRVPTTETQGRIHTSTCTVAIMPEANLSTDLIISPTDLKIDTFRASGAGGQHINKTDSAVRITHLPSGLVVECQDDRSQHRNREKAMQVLAARLKDKEIQESQHKEAAERKSLIGSGERSERIRTYNYPQCRITDHRINLTLYKLQEVLNGELEELTNILITENQAKQLEALSESE